MRIIIDLDGVICSEEKTFERSLAVPMVKAVESLEKLSEAGHEIFIYTARSWAEYAMTYAWLLENDIPFDTLICGKPNGDIWIDDRALAFTNWTEAMKYLDKE